jgi:hypothetical protein
VRTSVAAPAVDKASADVSKDEEFARKLQEQEMRAAGITGPISSTDLLFIFQIINYISTV